MATPDYSALIAGQREFFLSGATRPASWRKAQLKALKAMFAENHDELCDALWKDLRRNVVDADTMDVEYNVREADYALKHLDSWITPERVHTPLVLQPGHVRVRHDPHGVTLIIGAWNEPFMLLFAPLAAALAGGNTDLGVEMPLEEVPMIQKRIIRITRQAGKPVITATQMLGSMVENPRPTRAEATDVANAVLDGTDALMLSDETAMGTYPVEAVSTLDRIARTTEPFINEGAYLEEETSEMLHTIPAGISRAACLLALDLKAAVIVATTSSGNTARMVALFRPSAPIIALTDHIETMRQLSLSWGVIPHLVSSFFDTDQMFALARSWATQKEVVKPGDCLVVTAGVPVGVSGTTNLLKVMEI